MGSHSIDDEEIKDDVCPMSSDNNFQKVNIYNRYSPFSESITRNSLLLFDEIRENLSRTIQFGEFEPGFTIWSGKLKRYLGLYGFNFTKIDHLKLIDFYLSILSDDNLNYRYVDMCLNILFNLLRKTRLITRDDLIIDWRILYHWAKSILHNHDKDYSLVVPPKDLEISLIICTSQCSPYFSITATEEILEELRPQMCPTGWEFTYTVKMFNLFLPLNLPPDLHKQGFELWLVEFFTIWENIYNIASWELYMIDLFSQLAWHNIGYIDWECWLSKIFTRILRGFSLPIGKLGVSSQKYAYIESYSARWIIAMIGHGSSCFQYLEDLLLSMKSFYHPSNTGKFQEKLVKFLLKLTEYFLIRVQLERTSRPSWSFCPRSSHRLTEEDITNFVNCTKDYVFISIFNKTYAQEAVQACQYLSILRPQLIVPFLIQKHFSSIDSLTEPHRLTSIINCLKYISRQIVQQTSSYTEGQLNVIPLLMSVLPGIDLNDMKKTSATLDFLNTIVQVITCVDCSSLVDIRNDLTDIEKDVCLSTRKFEEFIIEFLNRIFDLIDILSADVSDGNDMNIDDDILDENIQTKLYSILFHIVQQCSEQIFEIIRERMMFFVNGLCLSSKIRPIVSCLIRSLVKGNPIETLKYFLPKTCQSIIKISDIDDKENLELNWYLSLFAELVRARGDILIGYKTKIMSVFHHAIRITNKKSYEILSNAIQYFLQSVTHIYSIETRLTVKNIDVLPIRTWGQSIDVDQLQVEFHLPNEEEIDLAWEFIETFLYSELNLLKEKGLTISNNERLRCLTIIESIAIGCFRIIPRIQSESIKDCLILSTVPYGSKYQTNFSIVKIKENLRMRLLIDIGKLIDQLLENHSDDVLSMKKALDFYPLVSIYYGTFANDLQSSYNDWHSNEKLLKNKLCFQGQPIRSLIIQRMELHIHSFESFDYAQITEIDREILLKVFQLSINRYSQVRRQAQKHLFSILKCFACSYQFLIDPIVQVFHSTDQIKGCLYALVGDKSFFLLTKSSWKMKEQLWPLIAQMFYGNKRNIANLYGEISNNIEKYFLTESIIQNTNELSRISAVNLWHSIETNARRETANQLDVQSYKNLIEKLCQLIENGTWTQQKITMSFLCLLLQRNFPIPLSCVKIFVDFLAHENIELRKFATKGVAALCRLQKPDRFYQEKSFEKLSQICPGDRDDNLWMTIDDYHPPKTQIEWEETCFLDKSFYGYYIWPKTIKYVMNKRIRYIEENLTEQTAILYRQFSDKMFIERVIQLMILDEKEEDKDFNRMRFLMFKGLFRNFGLAFLDNFIEQLYILIHERSRDKQEGCNRLAAEIVAGIIRGSKHWTLEMLDILWTKLRPFLIEICNNLTVDTLAYWNACFRACFENRDPRRMYRFIEFFLTLIKIKSSSNIFNEAAHWSLIRNLNLFDWRIPSIWHQIIECAQFQLDHSSPDVRERIAHLLAAAFSFDVQLFNGKTVRHPNTNQFLVGICEQLEKAIEIYQKTPLMNVSNQGIEIDVQVQKGLNLIKTVTRMHTLFFSWSRQPIKRSLIDLFPYLCEMESIELNDREFKEDLTISRLKIGVSYLNEELLELLIQQLLKICMSSKWHARRSAIEFVQNLIFCNLFNVRSHAQRLRQLVINGLFDQQYEVRIAASFTLAGFYQCGYIQVTNEDLNHFLLTSQTNYSENLVQRHGGILGFCAIVLSSPYDIPTYVPSVLMFLCEHSHDPDLIQKSIKTCLSEFRRTHYDSWHEHRQQFTDDQLVILADIFISHSYYA